MDRPIAWVRRSVRELRRRRVIRVAVAYATVAFVLLQLAEILVEPFGLGSWAIRLITLALILGFPLAVGLAWIYNLTEEGVLEVEEGVEADGGESPSETEPEVFDVPGARHRWFIAGAAAMLALLVALGWGLWPYEAPAFEEGEQLLLADVRNETADSLLTGSLTTALRTSLEQSPYLNVYSKTKVNEALSLTHGSRLMQAICDIS